MEVVTVDKRLKDGIVVISINRPHVRNCVDRETADALSSAFRAFDQDDTLKVAILTGSGGNFCAGADLKAMLESPESRSNRLDNDMDHDGPMGISRLVLSKPVVAAISGCAVAGGLELACWADLRVVDSSAYFGVYCRSKGVPLIDGGTVRLPRLIGLSAAMDMILTGRQVKADEAMALHLANYKAQDDALQEAIRVSTLIASHPQTCLRSDRASTLNPDDDKARLRREFSLGMTSVNSPDFGSAIREWTLSQRAVAPKPKL